MARQTIGIRSAFKITKKLWAEIGAIAVTQIKKRTQEGKDREGKRFPDYDEKYAELKASGFKRKTNRAGNRGTKIGSLFSGNTERQIHPPNFRLRGRTMGDLEPRRVTDKYAEIGWQNEYATIVAAHEDRGKYKVGGMSDDDMDQIMIGIDKHFVAQWNRETKDVVIHAKL